MLYEVITEFPKPLTIGQILDHYNIDENTFSIKYRNPVLRGYYSINNSSSEYKSKIIDIKRETYELVKDIKRERVNIQST